MFFNSWADLARVAVTGICAYLALIAMLRVSGKRTLSKMNAFDLIVTVALGSTLATVLLSKDVALAEGVLALAILLVLQFTTAWLSVRSATVSRLIKAEPALLFHNGEFLPRVMRTERVTEGEIRAAIRAQGIGSIDLVAAVVLETDGSVTVIPGPIGGAASALERVANHPPEVY